MSVPAQVGGHSHARSFNDLPEFSILQIFRFIIGDEPFKAESRRFPLTTVCKLWNSVAQTPSLCSMVVYSEDTPKFQLAAFESALRRAKNAPLFMTISLYQRRGLGESHESSEDKDGDAESIRVIELLHAHQEQLRSLHINLIDSGLFDRVFPLSGKLHCLKKLHITIGRDSEEGAQAPVMSGDAECDLEAFDFLATFAPPLNLFASIPSKKLREIIIQAVEAEPMTSIMALLARSPLVEKVHVVCGGTQAQDHETETPTLVSLPELRSLTFVVDHISESYAFWDAPNLRHLYASAFPTGTLINIPSLPSIQTITLVDSSVRPAERFTLEDEGRFLALLLPTLRAIHLSNENCLMILRLLVGDASIGGSVDNLLCPRLEYLEVALPSNLDGMVHIQALLQARPALRVVILMSFLVPVSILFNKPEGMAEYTDRLTYQRGWGDLERLSEMFP